MINKSLGSSLAHGLAKRDGRESDARFKAMDKRLLSALSRTKTETGAFNALVKALKDDLRKDMLFGFRTGNKKKQAAMFVHLLGAEDGFCLGTTLITKFPSIDIETYEPVLFTKHCVARLYQTFAVRNMKQFFKQYPDIVFRLWRCGMQGCESHERTPPPEDYESKLSLWHPQAEFRGFWLSGWIKLTTVISTASMSPIQSKKGLEKAEQEGRMINPGWEDYLASLKKNSNRSKFFVYR